MKAQVLYDLRQLTGYCSGTELHEFFEATLNDPSPKGNATIGMCNLPPQAFELYFDRDQCAVAMRQYGVNEQAIEVFLKECRPEDGLRKARELDYEIEMSRQPRQKVGTK